MASAYGSRTARLRLVLHLSLTGGSSISGGTTGVLVSGPQATLTTNGSSIFDNVTGIDVDGGTATITSNHVHHNAAGIRLTNGGTASITGNDFDGGVGDDNGIDLQLTSSAGRSAP